MNSGAPQTSLGNGDASNVPTAAMISPIISSSAATLLSSAPATNNLSANSDIRPNDVLLGRGKGSNQYSGNIAFRRVVDSRRADYDAKDTKYGDKGRIARQVYACIVRPGNDGQLGGRFMMPAESNEAIRKAREANRPVCFYNGKYWIEAPEGVAIDKCRMALRQKDKSAEQREARRKKRLSLGGTAKVGQSSRATSGMESTAPTLSSPASATASAASSSPLPVSLRSHISLQQPDKLTSAAMASAAAALDAVNLNADKYGANDKNTTGDLDTWFATDHLSELGAGMTHDGDISPFEPTPIAVMSAHHNKTRSSPHSQPHIESQSPTRAAASPLGSGGDNILTSIHMALFSAQTFRQRYRTAAGTEEEKNTCIDDLRSLGRIIYDIIARSAPQITVSNTSTSTCTRTEEILNDGPAPAKKERRRSVEGGRRNESGFVPLLELGYPVRLSTLVDCLMNQSASECYYESASEVAEDLQHMLADPDRHLYGNASATAPDGQLHFANDRIYGRKEESAFLASAFDQVVQSGEQDRHLVTISGYSGTGKTSLVDQIRSRLHNNRAMMVSCKFSSQDQEQPMSLLFRAFDDYCRNLSRVADPALLEEVRLTVSEALGSNAAILKGRLPSLSYIIGDIDDDSVQSGGKTDEINRIVYYFLVFVRAISGPRHPLVIFLDDLQWCSDQSCIDLIKMLLKDTAIKSTLFIGCYRDDEVPPDHPLAELLGEITMDAVVPMSLIALNNLDKESVNDLLSDALCLSPRFTRPLASALYAKTRGNPMFFRQLLISLAEERLIQFSASTRRWEWDIGAINAKSVADNAVDVIVGMMRMYEPEDQWVLRAAALLGWAFDVPTIERLVGLPASFYGYRCIGGSSVAQHLETVVAGGLMVRDGSALRFSHDQIWQAAYGLTPALQREQAHLDVGRHLLGTITAGDEDELDTFLFTIVNQCNKGCSLITDHDEQMRLAELNLKAGEKSMAATSFFQASLHLLQGSVFIGEKDWESNYDLCLRIFTACGEVQLTQGNRDGAILSATPVLKHGRTLHDKLRAHHTLILAKLSRGLEVSREDHDDAVQHGLTVLKQLGESFPVDIDQAVIKQELRRTQAMVASRSVESISQQSIATDGNEIVKMRFLLIVSRIAYGSNPNLMLLLITRMVTTSMTSGLTPEASFAFATFAFALCGLGNHNLSDFCSRVALSLLQKFDQKYSQIVLCLLNLSILPYKQPLQACVDSFKRAHKDGMAVGDVEWAMISLRGATNASVFASERGKTLKDMEMEIEHNIDALVMFRRGVYVAEGHICRAAVENLVNCPSDDDSISDPTVLAGDSRSDDESLLEHSAVLQKRLFYRIWLAYLFHRYDKAAELVKEHQDIAATNPFAPSYDTINEQFYLGLLSAVLQRQAVDGATTWRDMSTGIVSKFRIWAEEGSAWNFEHKLDLLCAEKAYSDGDIDTAAAAYDEAILRAGTTGYIHEEALACERSGIFYMERNNMAEAITCLEKAIRLYHDWGAARKVMDLQSLLNECVF